MDTSPNPSGRQRNRRADRYREESGTAPEALTRSAAPAASLPRGP